MALDICGSSVYNTLYGTSLTHKILRWLLDFWKTGAPLFEAKLTLTHVLIEWFLKHQRDFHLYQTCPVPYKTLSPNALTPNLHYTFQWLFECHFQEGGSWPIPHMSLPDDPVQLLSVSILWLLHGHQHAANTYLETKHHYTKHIHTNSPLILYCIMPEREGALTNVTCYALPSRLALGLNRYNKLWIIIHTSSETQQSSQPMGTSSSFARSKMAEA